MWPKMKDISIYGYILSLRVFIDENKYISITFVAKSNEHGQRISIRFTSMIFIKRKLLWIFYQFFSSCKKRDLTLSKRSNNVTVMNQLAEQMFQH